MYTDHLNTDHLDAARLILDTLRTIRLHLIPRHLAAALEHPDRTEDAPPPELTVPQFNALVAVRDRGQVTIKELAMALGVSAPSASTMVDRLLELAMVSRRQSEADRREVIVALTPEGEQAACRLEAVLLRGICELLDRLGPDHAAKWVEVYARIREVLESDAHTAGVSCAEGADKKE